MKKSVKSKKTKGSSKASKAAKSELPELVAVMMKIAERLEALEKKTDLVISQTSVRPSEIRQVSQNFERPEPQHHAQPQQHPNQGPQQNSGQRGRVLHQAVCADCHEDCEVPFKPSGDRPVYCKECFAKRKAGGNSPKTNVAQNRMPNQQGPAKVFSHGAGQSSAPKIAVPSAHDHSQKGKKHKPAKKSKK